MADPNSSKSLPSLPWELISSIIRLRVDDALEFNSSKNMWRAETTLNIRRRMPRTKAFNTTTLQLASVSHAFLKEVSIHVQRLSNEALVARDYAWSKHRKQFRKSWAAFLGKELKELPDDMDERELSNDDDLSRDGLIKRPKATKQSISTKNKAKPKK